MPETFLFQTKRVHVRNLRPDDLSDFQEMQGNEEVMRYVGGARTAEENRKDLDQVITLYNQPNNSFWVWAIAASNGKFVGTCAIIKNDNNEWEIGCRFLKRFWGKGYGTEITQGLIEHAFQQMKILQLHAYVDRENRGSVKILNHYFDYLKDVWNSEDQCWDRKYSLKNPLS